MRRRPSGYSDDKNKKNSGIKKGSDKQPNNKPFGRNNKENSRDNEQPKRSFTSVQRTTRTNSKPSFKERQENKGKDRRTPKKLNTDKPLYRKEEGERNERKPARKYSSGHSRNRDDKQRSPIDRKTTAKDRFTGAKKTGGRFSSDKQERSFDEKKKPVTFIKGKTPARKGFDKRSKKREEEVIEPTGLTRLNKYIANAGISSRREADNLISAGLVSVNGEVITEMGYQVKPGDVVKYNGSKLSTEKKVYLIMNKPKDTITTLDDPEGRKIVTDLLKDKDLPRVFPVGRLDRNTTGVLLLTNDGELTQRLMHPKYEVQKIYTATLSKSIKGEDFWTLTNGVELEDGFMKPDSIAMPDPKSKKEVAIEIHSGRNRIVHRMFEHLGYPLEKLDRIWYAGLNKKSLKRGEWRHLNDRELTALKKLVKMK